LENNTARLPAEWEEQEFVQLAFPHKNTDWAECLEDATETFVKIAKAIAKYQKVLIIAKDLSHVKSLFEKKKNCLHIFILRLLQLQKQFAKEFLTHNFLSAHFLK